jgi:hypothetical protein
MTKQVEELIAHLRSLSDEALRELATTPEWALFMHKVYRSSPGQELTLERIEWDARICRQYPAPLSSTPRRSSSTDNDSSIRGSDMHQIFAN